ncbi:hypothetical protein [Pseudomonas sp. dw_358]|uniref:hypothetical protein n=1 Tax=Pseudomonas sp. dw_358 TaxID=2720083 RepID=UPI001BD2E0AE|nr:hypothetical protein [Pseudomonas sp. dw_358]
MNSSTDSGRASVQVLAQLFRGYGSGRVSSQKMHMTGARWTLIIVARRLQGGGV